MNLMIQISLIVICLFIIWRIYKVIQTNPGMLSRENLGKSFTMMGILALILIGFVGMLVYIVRHS